MGTKKQSTSRQVAVLCLVAWHKKMEPIGPLIENIIHQSSLKAVDRHLAVNIVQGVLRQMQYLDRIIARFSKFPLKKMKTLTLMTLRVGVYQLMFLERIPDSAAVNETVKVLKIERQPRWLVSFVNGVLRNVVRNREDLPETGAGDSKKEYSFNHPEWLVERWLDRYGSDRTREICQNNNREPFLSIRVNTLRIGQEELAESLTEQGHSVCLGTFAPDSLILDSYAGPVTSLDGYVEGLFHIQDESAQLVTCLLGPFEEGGERYLDACAGLGGKTCHLAELVSTESEIVAVEPSRNRITLLEENCKRLQLDMKKIHIFSGRLDMFIKSEPGLFKGVLVDAPCSGTGVIRRHPDIRWNRQPGDLLLYCEKQLELLEQAATFVEPGGVLVYATCSMEPEENSQVISTFLSRHDDFSVSDCRGYLPAQAEDLVTQEGFFAPTPADGVDGFFGARLVRAM